jgi:hypothetical protein
MGASRLQQNAHILQTPVPFFFEGAPQHNGQSNGNGEASSPAYVAEFLIKRRARAHHGIHADNGTKHAATHRRACRGALSSGD